jgi:hypothetical protein
MAKREWDRDRDGGAFKLSDADVERAWEDILEGFRPPKGRATAAWEAMGSDYKRLGERST